MGNKAKTTEINKINITPSGSATKSKDIADTLNVHFTNVVLNLASKIPSPSNTKSFKGYLTKVNSIFKFEKISLGQVQKLLKTCDAGNAVGLDKISKKILKISAPYICASLAELFNLSLESNIAPADWKTGK